MAKKFSNIVEKQKYWDSLSDKYGNKVTCELCNRVVVQSKLNRHRQSEICKRKRANVKI